MEVKQRRSEIFFEHMWISSITAKDFLDIRGKLITEEAKAFTHM